MYRTAGRPATVRARPPLPRRADRLLEFDAHSPHDLVHLVVARVEVRREPQPDARAMVEQDVLREQRLADANRFGQVEAHRAAAAVRLARRAHLEAGLVRERQDAPGLAQRLLADGG